MKFRAKTAFVTPFGGFSEGDEFNASAEEVQDLLRAGHVEPVGKEPEVATSPIPQRAERAVRVGRR